MARRLFNGRAFSENGWPYVDEAGCTWIVVPGTNPPVHLQIQTGPPVAIMGAWAADWNAYVEPLRDADSAAFTQGNSVATSNHPGGTAEDLDWDSHPFQVWAQPGVGGCGFTAAQIATIGEMVDFYEGNMFWANNWDSPKDAMHSQMGYDTYDRVRDRPFPKVFDFIARKIRADGFSTFRRGDAPQPSDAAAILSQATGLSLSRAMQILPTVISGLHAADCTNVNRIAMWLAQCGEESAGFSTTEEFASGAEYEGRCSDLGNCSPGDGVKYKGRTWIQITGKAHYREFSAWAFGKGLTASPMQFVGNPASLGDLQWAGIGAAWYWTVSRPDINALSDAGDVITVTHRINGGEHGLADRQSRYARAHALGSQLLALTTGDDDMFTDADRDLLKQMAGYRRKSRSALRWPGEGEIDTCAGFAWSADGNGHVQLVEKLAVGYGDPNSIAMLVAVAACAGDPKFPDRQEDAKLAARILAKVPADAKAAGAKQIQAWLDAETKP